MIFNDRIDAANRLADALGAYRDTRPLVLAIPRGAVPMGRIIADALGGELDVALVRKLGAPFSPEFAVGAVDETGWAWIAPHARQAGAGADYLAHEKALQLETLRKRRARYTPARPPISPTGRVAIVVDDGLATGATMIAALHAVRARKPKTLVCAVPVAAPDSLVAVRDYCDDVVCLESPEDFGAVGRFYRNFDQVSDDEVVRLLSESTRRPGATARAAAAPSASAPAPIPARAAERRAAPRRTRAMRHDVVRIDCGGVTIEGGLMLPPDAHGLVLFAHGSGSSRHSPRNVFVASRLHARGIGTLLVDLLTPDEDADPANRFDIPLLTDRLGCAARWLAGDARTAGLRIGLFGASTGAASALRLAAALPQAIAAVVSRGGRPDLAGADALARVKAPTLLVVGGRDDGVIALNQAAHAAITADKRLAIVPGATHLFEEPGTLEQVADLAADWFARHLAHVPVA